MSNTQDRLTPLMYRYWREANGRVLIRGPPAVSTVLGQPLFASSHEPAAAVATLHRPLTSLYACLMPASGRRGGGLRRSHSAMATETGAPAVPTPGRHGSRRLSSHAPSSLCCECAAPSPHGDPLRPRGGWGGGGSLQGRDGGSGPPASILTSQSLVLSNNGVVPPRGAVWVLGRAVLQCQPPVGILGGSVPRPRLLSASCSAPFMGAHHCGNIMRARAAARGRAPPPQQHSGAGIGAAASVLLRWRLWAVGDTHIHIFPCIHAHANPFAVRDKHDHSVHLQEQLDHARPIPERVCLRLWVN